MTSEGIVKVIKITQGKTLKRNTYLAAEKVSNGFEMVIINLGAETTTRTGKVFTTLAEVDACIEANKLLMSGKAESLKITRMIVTKIIQNIQNNNTSTI